MTSRQLTVDSRQEPETGGEDRNRDASSPANCQLPTANSRLEVRLTGFGGQGVVLAAHIIGRACIEAGKHATMIQSFGPEARGASCSATLVISPDEVLYPYIQQPEILVAMSGDGYEKFKDELKPGGTLIYESDLVKPVGGWRLAVGGSEPLDSGPP
ncbi:MAG: 2-oxoacid:acceptor oxidoreductase family protein, partial [Thermoanaerobaculia bacterium]